MRAKEYTKDSRGIQKKVPHPFLCTSSGPWIGELRPSGIRNLTWTVEGRICQ